LVLMDLAYSQAQTNIARRHQTASITGGIFISYRRGDHGQSRMIYEALTGRFEGVFADTETIRPGLSWRKVIEEAIGSCRAVVAVIGPDWLGATTAEGEPGLKDPADAVRRELEVALRRGVPIFPVLVGGAGMPAGDELPESLAAISEIQALTISEDVPDQDLRRLVELIESELGSQAPFAPGKAPDALAPDASRPEGDQVPSTRSLKELMDGTGLKFLAGDDGVLRVPFEALRAGEVVVYARELSEADLHFFAVYLPDAGRLGKWRGGDVDRGLLRMSFAATYIKAMVIDSRLLLAAEIPTSVVTPSIAEGVVRALARLGDLQKGDMRDEGTWRTVIEGATIDQATYTDLNLDRLREETLATLTGAGLDPQEIDESSYLVELDIVEGQPLKVAVRPHQLAVSLIAGFGNAKPKNKAALRQVLEINSRANIARVGIDHSGDLAFLYEVPHLLPPHLEHASVQFDQLLVELASSDVVES